MTNAPAASSARGWRVVFWQRAGKRRSGLAVMYPDILFLLSDGVCYSGHAVSGGKNGSGPLALKRELRGVFGAVPGAAERVEASQASLEELEVEIQTLDRGSGNGWAEQQQEKETWCWTRRCARSPRSSTGRLRS